LSNGDYYTAIQLIQQTSFKQIFQLVSLLFPSGSLDRNPPRLLIYFREFRRDFAPTRRDQSSTLVQIKRVGDMAGLTTALRTTINIGHWRGFDFEGRLSLFDFTRIHRWATQTSCSLNF
jgi:hypothetical protein